MRSNRLARSLKFVAALTLATSSLAQDRTSCEADTSGIETITTIWGENRPLPWPSDGSAGFGERSAQFVSLNVAPEGDLPRELTITPDGTTALVANLGSFPLAGGTVSFVDIASRAVTGSVSVGQFPVSVAVSPNGQYAVTANLFSNDATIIDVATRTVLATVPLTGTQPMHVRITSDSQYAVVGLTNDAISSSFSVIDLATRTQIRSFASGSQGSIGVYATPEFAISGSLHTYFALTPDGTRIVLPVSTASGGRVAIYSIATGAELASIPTAASPRSIDISADGARAVIGHEGNANRVSVIDLTTSTLLNSWTTPSGLQNQVIAITPDNAYAIASISNNVIFVNLATGTTDATLAAGIVGDIVIVDNNTAFVSSFDSRVINLATRTVSATLSLAPTVEAAVTSTLPRKVVALNSRFREDVHFYTINGASSTVDGLISSGPTPEGDCTKPLAISPDGSTIVAGNTISRNASIIDAATGTIRATVDTGDRVAGVAITPNGQTAVVANSDGNTVSIINLTTNTRVAQLPVSQRPWEVRIHPNGTLAAVLSVAGTDLIHWININGAASSVLGTTLAGQTGSAFAYSYTETSGIEFSPDGSVLAVCRSFDDQIRLINSTTREVITDVTVGDFPIRIGFVPDGTRAYVSNTFSDDISVISIAGASSTLLTTIPGIDTPFRVISDTTGQFVYVNNVGALQRIAVISTTSNSLVGSVTIPNSGIARDMELMDGTLFAAGTDTQGASLWSISAAGPASAVTSTSVISGSPFNLRARGGTIAVTQPGPDGIDLVRLGPVCDSIDFNNDTSIFDPTDVDAFFSVFSEGPCIPATATCNDVDFNNDTSIFDPCDVDAFLLAFSEGPCTLCGQ
jgi:YVTN family beta-propeller protein